MDFFGRSLLVLVAVALVAYEFYANKNRMVFVWSVWKRFRPLMLIEVLVTLMLTITIVVTLWEYVPFLRWGWLNLFFSGGGNIILAPVLEASQQSNMLARTLPLIFVIALFVAMPFFTHYEEKEYRRGYYGWGEITRQSIKFGLVHLWAGIPLAAGIGLILPGFFFAWKYRSSIEEANGPKVWGQIQNIKEEYRARGVEVRVETEPRYEDEAVMASTAYHTLYNSLIISLPFVFTVVHI